MASSNSPSLLENGLPKVHRFITTHNNDAKAVYSTKFEEALEWENIPNGANFSLGYTTNQFPVEMNGDKDLSIYAGYLENKPGLVTPGGTTLRYVDIGPGVTSPMHRTVSLDYGVVLEGEVELILDSGETRLMRRGDVAIQRGTMHAWRNTSEAQWVRMLYVLQVVEALKVGSETLGEDYGGLAGVRSSE